MKNVFNCIAYSKKELTKLKIKTIIKEKEKFLKWLTLNGFI